jgi:hypothetical protein
MALNGSAAYGMYSREAALYDIVHTFNHAGYRNQDICMMLAPSHPIARMVREAGVLDSNREAGAVTAGLIGWLSEFGAVVIPTVGFFIHSQAFFHALMATDSPRPYESPKTLAALGLPDDEAERLEDKLEQVGVLVYVSCPETANTMGAFQLLRQTGARETATLHAEFIADSIA